MKSFNTTSLAILFTTMVCGCNSSDQSYGLQSGGQYQSGNKRTICEGGNSVDDPTLGGGDGSKEHPYLLCTLDHFIKGIGEVGSGRHQNFYKLMADLDFSNQEVITRLGFIDSFDGNNHKFKNITLKHRPGLTGIALFGQITAMPMGGYRGEIKNLIIENVKVTGGENCEDAAVVAIANYDGLISNVHVTGNIEMSENSTCKTDEKYAEVGGLVGTNGSDIEDSSFEGTIHGPTTVGGIAAINTGKIRNSHTSGEFKGLSGVGGVVGLQLPPGAILASTSTSSPAARSNYFGISVGYDCIKETTNLCQYDLERPFKP